MRRTTASIAALACAVGAALASVPADAAPRRFTWSDYAYTLTIGCYCPREAPVRVTVHDGVVTTAVFAADDAHHHTGDVAPKRYRRTIAGLLRLARSDKVDRAVVRWPATRVAPSSIYLDFDLHMADEEVSYGLSLPVRLR